MRLEKIREVFLEYFKKQNHTAVPSSSLIPGNDPTLLFTNAGMVQFKDAFLGKENLGYKRATSSQRCVRAGGKHNDLENVGYTARHHTFFEMLGNFSFGDYFKREAIAFAWEFLTVELKLPAEKLWVTVHSKDKETEQIWFDEMGISQTRFSRCGDKDNFWSMGDTGPCGYCTEIFYDHGPSIPGGPPGSPEEDGDRYVEIWNLVFMQYDRSSNGTLTPLPAPSVDTGMGIERLAAVMQGVQSNYDIDLFVNIIKSACHILEVKDERQSSLRVIADHIRSCSFLILDGVIPSNEGRGYVLRRIIRRAVRHGNHLAASEPFFYKLVAALVSVMGNAYPSLKENQALIERVLLQEEEQFAKTLETGLRILDQELVSIPAGGVLSGEVAFKLYDTYGFPVDLTADILREKGMTVDQAGFEQAMNEQRDRARKSSQFEMKEDNIKLEGNTPFLGYEQTDAEAEIAFIYVDAKAVDHVDEGQKAAIVLDETPFYAESGGQIGDKGHLITSTGEFFVEDTQKSGDVIVHYGHMIKGKLKLGTEVKAKVDDARRQHIRRHHSATHLLHAALRKILGPHVTQKGSLVDANRLRFDFSHMEALSENELRDIESMVNAQILKNSEVVTEIMTLEAAKQKGAMALFGEKYGETVRVLTMGDSYSIEFCGGTHVSRTGDIGLFKITSEMGVAAGIRRIEGVSGDKAMSLFMEQQALLSKAFGLLKCDKTTLLEKIENQFSKIKAQEKEIAVLNQKLISGKGADISAEAIDKGGIKVLAKEVEVSDPKMLRVMLDQLKDKLGKAIIVLAARQDGKVSLVAGVTDNCTDRFSAGELIGLVAQEVGGKGGGRADMAQAGGTNPTNIPKALAIVVPWVENKL